MKLDSRAPQHKRPPFRRRRKLVKPRLQLHLIITFAGLSAIGLLLQAQLISSELAKLSLHSSAGVLPSELFPGMILRVLAYSFLGLLPLTVAVGVLTTFRIAGPVYRFEQHLTAVAKGEQIGPCTIRKGDELHDLCDRINEAVAALREERVPQETTDSVNMPDRRAA